jgi:hypothetical protein
MKILQSSATPDSLSTSSWSLLIDVENGPDLSAEVAESPTVPCESNDPESLRTSDGDPVTVILLDTLCVPILTRMELPLTCFGSRHITVPLSLQRLRMLDL